MKLVSYIGGILLALVALVVFSSTVTVNSGEVGVKSTFGKVNAQALPPGLHLVTPFISSVSTISTRLIARPEEFTSLTNDSQRVKITATATLSISPDQAPVAFAAVARTSNEIVDKVVQPVLLAAVKQVASKYPITYIIENQQQVADEISSVVTEDLSSKSFIDFQRFDVTGFELDSNVQEAIEGRQIAKQELERKRTELETAKIEAQRLDILDGSLTPAILTNKAIEKWDGSSLVPPGSEFPGVLTVPANK
ncbi:prohibitin family protein [Phormidium tenue FACHB-886]|nr:prohibitin family protein [Phormidium tenue FACHB-886]